MSLRYQKRVNLGSGLGVNVSGSGLSPSVRTKHGSIGPRGFSIRTGIPGLSFRSTFGSKKGGGVAAIVAVLLVGFIIAAGLLLWNIALFIAWAIREGANSYRRYKHRKGMTLAAGNAEVEEEDVTSFVFERTSVPEKFRSSGITMSKTLIEDGSFVNAGQDVAEIDVAGNKGTLQATCSGTLEYFKSQGERIHFGDCLYKIRS